MSCTGWKNTRTPGMPATCSFSRPSSVSTLSRRSARGFSVMTTRPAFGVGLIEFVPTTETTPSTDGSARSALTTSLCRRCISVNETSGPVSVMATIERLADAPYRWRIGDAPLQDIANVERKMPAEFITADGFHITDACRTYLQPLIEGEDPPPYRNGLPDYVRLKNVTVAKKLGAFKV